MGNFNSVGSINRSTHLTPRVPEEQNGAQPLPRTTIASYQAQQRTWRRSDEIRIRNGNGASASAGGPTADDLIRYIFSKGIEPAELQRLTMQVRILVPSNDAPICPYIKAAMAEGEKQAFCATVALLKHGCIRLPSGQEDVFHFMAPETDGRIRKLFPDMRGGYLSAGERVAVLVDLGFNVDGQDEFGQTPLHCASKQREPNINLMSALLAHGADASIIDDNGLSAAKAWARKGVTLETMTRNS